MHVARIEERRDAYRFCVSKPERKRPHELPTRRWEDNIKMDLQSVGWGAHGLYLAQDREGWRAFVNAVMNLRVP